MTQDEADIFPDFVKICEGFGVPAERNGAQADLKGAIQHPTSGHRASRVFPRAHAAHGARRRHVQGYLTTGDGRETKDMKTL